MSSIAQFSQGSLQDYADCPRRYQLRYRLMQPWPMLLPPSPQEAELHLQRGSAFHHLLHQYYAGVAASCLATAAAGDPTLLRWWETYLLRPPPELPATYLRPEAVLSAPLAGHRLVARLDLLAIEPGAGAAVIDWKTSSMRPTRSALAQRLQTRVYRYLLLRSLLETGHAPLEAGQVEMVYWFCEFDGAVERFPYSSEQFSADEAYLTELVREISGRREAIWPVTLCEDRCSYCRYQSLCDRRVGSAVEIDDVDSGVTEPEFDIEQIAEVPF